MLADHFAHSPHRHELLKAVWAGFTTLIERAQVGGAEDIGYASVLAAQRKETLEMRATLQAELDRVSEALKGDLAAAQAETEAASRRGVDLGLQIEAADALVTRTAAERDQLKEELAGTASKLDTEIAQRERVEQLLVVEQKNAIPIREKAEQLPKARSETRLAQGQLVQRMKELTLAKQRADNVQVLAVVHEMSVQVCGVTPMPGYYKLAQLTVTPLVAP